MEVPARDEDGTPAQAVDEDEDLHEDEMDEAEVKARIAEMQQQTIEEILDDIVSRWPPHLRRGSTPR